jgi:hypothetical protein
MLMCQICMFRQVLSDGYPAGLSFTAGGRLQLYLPVPVQVNICPPEASPIVPSLQIVGQSVLKII